MTERRAFVGTRGEVFVEALHESDREDIVGGPEAGNHGFGAGEKERAFETGDAFRAQEFSGAGLAGRKDNQVGAKGKIANLADLQKTVVR